MKDLRSLAVVSTIFVLAGVACAQVQTPLVASGKTREIAEHVYVIPDQRINVIPNIGIIVGRDGVLVVDTGMGPRNAETVLGEVKICKLGADSLDSLYTALKKCSRL